MDYCGKCILDKIKSASDDGAVITTSISCDSVEIHVAIFFKEGIYISPECGSILNVMLCQLLLKVRMQWWLTS
ncbi:hypothetical protein DFR30_2694 [Thiogranum longum]|uniref:Uncharacterized protein n=1 Tax=Thiogranum longum TaxID=1537524 RepID=A0A4R1HFC9_9GAMM|nr:hypothetical protein DFR30_2694 [Thiogranum longum]